MLIAGSLVSKVKRVVHNRWPEPTTDSIRSGGAGDVEGEESISSRGLEVDETKIDSSYC
jgi:hypothetical protein